MKVHLMAKPNLSEPSKDRAFGAVPATIRGEEQATLDMRLDGLLVRGTNEPTAVDEGRWLNLYRQVYCSNDVLDESQPYAYPVVHALLYHEHNEILNEEYYASLWNRVSDRLRSKVGGDVYASWFKRLKLEQAGGPVVRLSVPTPFLMNWINNHYLDMILEMWKAEEPNALKVEVLVRSATRGTAVSTHAGQAVDAARVSAERAKANALAKAARMTATGPGRQGVAENARNGEMLGSPVDIRCTFDSFVEGPSNRVCLVAARAAVEKSSSAARFNPLFFHSKVGLGKTHLLQAIANAAKRKDPTKLVVYLTAENFMWRFASAIRDQSALRFKEALHEIDVLIIDDMQFLQGEKIQSEFCHLINTLSDSARLVVVAGDRPPSELESLDPRVRSRLQSGVALEIQPPDFDMRLAVLQRRLAEARRDDTSLDISAEVLTHVAQTVTSGFRELEGAFKQLVFRHSFEPDITLDGVDDILGHLVRINDEKKIRIEDIQKTVAIHYNVAPADLQSNRRTRSVVRPRQIAMYLSKMMTPRSLPEIGRRFGGRDHTTVLHAVRKVETLIKEDPGLAKELELIRMLIRQQESPQARLSQQQNLR